MTGRLCAGDVSERVHLGTYQACDNDVEWDIIAYRVDAPGRVAAVCDDCLPSRLREWYDALKDCERSVFKDNEWFTIVRPYDAAFVDPDEQDYLESLQAEIRRVS